MILTNTFPTNWMWKWVDQATRKWKHNYVGCYPDDWKWIFDGI